MNRNTLTLGMCLFGMMAGTAMAAEQNTPGATGDKAQMHGTIVPNSIAREGKLAKFEVDATANANASAPDRVRYVVDCSKGMLAVSGAAETDQKPAETRVTPPRQAKWMKPAPGSDQADWMDRACKG